MMKNNFSYSLQHITIRAIWRRGSSFFLAAIVATGVFSSVVLHQYTEKQEAALADTIANTKIQCIITDVQGMNQHQLRAMSGLVDMLMGRREDQEIAWEQIVTNIRAWASYPLEYPQNASLQLITSPDATFLLSAENGVAVKFLEGWNESAFYGTEKVCLISESLMLQESEENLISIQIEKIGVMQLKVIGTFTGGSSENIFCPFYLPWPDGLSHSFSINSCSFDILDNQRLEESREQLFSYFAEPKLENTISSADYGLIIQDDTFIKTVEELDSNIHLLHLLLPVFLILFFIIGFLAAGLSIRSRKRNLLLCVALA